MRSCMPGGMTEAQKQIDLVLMKGRIRPILLKNWLELQCYPIVISYGLTTRVWR